MVKSPDQRKQSPSSSERSIAADSSSCKYKGVRKRKWGKFVSEIRLPNCRERIWLGSYDTAEKAARAFDAALFCLRGRNAKFNFPDNPPDIADGRSMTPPQIQAAAARFAHSAGPVHDLDSLSDSVSSSHVESPCPSVSECGGVTEMPLDTAFLDQFLNMGTENIIPDFGLFPGFDDFMANPFPSADYYWPENNDEFTSQGSFLWNF